ncbi:MAG: SusC/RagA family TonB-linked outer membrane protein [Tannerellaceae bacterium]|jgi:TonB-linked SusC/RagA family outer membrane protein|nr:SusC/RagA family TonB-linked outer membrane protein [Tannerellaceae bacterium]
MKKIYHAKGYTLLAAGKSGIHVKLLTILLFSIASSLQANNTNSPPELPQTGRKTITGTVLDDRGEAIIGANVVEKGTANGMITDVNGNFSLPVGDGAVLQISYIGYVAQEITVGNRNNFLVTMREDSQALSEVVVVGYGTMRKQDLTGSISHVNAEKLAFQRPATVQDIIRNTAPGLIVGPSSSDAKESPSFLIRGTRTLKGEAAARPLVVLNGVPFNGELSEINPVDIESIDVLKDASSAAIYGAKSANGVIIISTRKGRGDKPTVKFDGSVGFATMGANREYYKPKEYLQYRSDYATSSNGFEKQGYYSKPTPENLQKYGLTEEQWRTYDAIGQGSDNMEDVWLQRIGLGDVERKNYFAGETYDWYGAVWQTGLRQNYNVSLSGQTDRVNYYWSLGYQDNEGNQRGDRFVNYRTNLRLDAKATDFLEVGANLLLQTRDEGFQRVDWSGMCYNSPYSTPYYEDGTLNPWPMGQGHQAPGTNSEYSLSMSTKSAGTQTVTTNLYGKLKLPFNISYQFNFAPRYSWQHDRNWSSSESVFDTTHGSADRFSARSIVWTLDNIIKWNYTFADKHLFDVTLLQSAEQYQYWSERMNSSQFSPTDILQWHYVQAANEKSISSNDEKYTGDAMMGRLFYSYDNRYMITASVRRDGYSAFGRSNPHATFPSLALAWNFTNEKFFNRVPMSNGKLRLSWGKNGNREVGIYQALSQLTTSGISKYTYATQTGSLYELSTLQIARMSNNDLRWESTASWNAGLDFGFLDNRLNGSAEWYYMPTTDLLMDRSLPNVTGYSSVVTNLGRVTNSGFEFSLNSINIEKENVMWATTFGMSHNRNRIEHLYYTYEDIVDANGNVVGSKEVDDVHKGWFIGRDMSTIWANKFIGVWQVGEEEEAARYGQKPGDARANDLNGDYRISQDDKEFCGVRDPKVRLSLSNEFVLFRNWDFSFNLYSYLGHKSTSTDYLNFFDFKGDYRNSPVRDYWTAENKSNSFARLKSTLPANVEPQKIIRRDFIRLENISVGYKVPKRIANTLHTQDIRLYGTIRNVAILAFSKDWSKANYWDVETGGSMPRTYTIGASVTF